jgi:hypothetical protein
MDWIRVVLQIRTVHLMDIAYVMLTILEIVKQADIS